MSITRRIDEDIIIMIILAGTTMHNSLHKYEYVASGFIMGAIMRYAMCMKEQSTLKTITALRESVDSGLSEEFMLG